MNEDLIIYADMKEGVSGIEVRIIAPQENREPTLQITPHEYPVRFWLYWDGVDPNVLQMRMNYAPFRRQVEFAVSSALQVFIANDFEVPD